MGICMDINPRRFEAPWTAYEFATHCVEKDTPLVVLSMAWLTRLLPQDLKDNAMQPDLETLTYWIERFFPIVGSKREGGVVLVLANRCGNEPGTVAGVSQGTGEDGEEVVIYAGTSCVLRVQDGNVQLFDILGRAEEALLVADTDEVSARSNIEWALKLMVNRLLVLRCEQRPRLKQGETVQHLDPRYGRSPGNRGSMR